MSKPYYPYWMDTPIEFWEDEDVHKLLNQSTSSTASTSTKPCFTLDEHLTWVEKHYPEAHQYIGMVKYWRNKQLQESQL